MPNLTTEAGFVDIFCANVDGKWDEEIVKVNNVISGTNDQVVFKVFTTDLCSGLRLKDTRTFDLPTVLEYSGFKSIHPKFYQTSDFNGDGKMEILAVSCNNPLGLAKPSKCYLFDLDSNTKLYEGQPFAYNVIFAGTSQLDTATIVQNTDKLYVLDYDGDGKSDIYLINSSGTYIYTFDISGSTYSMRQVASYTGLKRADLNGKILMVGEFNGDGKPDFLLSPVIDASDWYIFYAMGNGQFEKVQVSINKRYSIYSYLIQDINSDGLTDVIEYSTSNFWTYRAKNGGFSSWDSNASFSKSNPYFVPTNINSRNYFHQLVALRNDGKVDRFSYPRNDTKEKLLTGAVSSLGVVGKNYYRMLNESTYLYTKGSGAVYPYENFQGPLFVPETREQYFNGALNENSSYAYENAVIHKQGLGFRGFEKIYFYDNMRGRSQSRKFDPYNFGVLKEEDSPTATVSNTYSVSVASNKTAKIQLTNRSTLDKLKNNTVSAAYTYDTYGNPLTENIDYGGGINESTSNTYSNNTDETSYLLGFLTNQITTTTRNGSYRTKGYNIPSNNGKGQPNAIIQMVSYAPISYETFGYDAQGNTASKGVKTYESTNVLTTTYKYDNYGRLQTETDPLGLVTTYEYNSTNGSLSAVKNHKGQISNLYFDPLFRKSGYTYPNGIFCAYYYSWESVESNGLYSIKKTEDGKPWIKTFYDAFGRETASSELNFNSTETIAEKQYDSYGRLQKESLPYIGTAASNWNTYQYDSYDRITSYIEASGRKTTYSYSGNSVTTTKDGISSTQTFDTQGNLISVSDPAGTITYNLRPDGQPSSIVAPGSITTSFTYDNYGRQTGITDPSAGIKSFAYDAAGNIATETDANNKSLTYEYDIYNRMTKRICPEYTANYRYNSDGLLAADSINSTLFTSYAYDEYGRLQKEKETVAANRWIEKGYIFYGLGQLGYTTYNLSDKFTTAETYAGCDKDEGIKGITVDGTDIWKWQSSNALGQTTGVTTGNFNRTYSFDAYGMPTGRTASSFQNHTYSFDATKGNLSSRKDNVKNIQENFTYDNLNRLTGFAGKTAAYDVKGNITSRTDAGTFQYSITGKPYALSGVTSPTNLIPQRNQTVTYTSFQRPATITEGEYTAAFTYNGNYDRVKMELKKNGAKELTRYYLSGCYEIDDRAVGGVKEKLYLGGDFYTASAVYVKEGTGNWNLYYICRDYLGSITHITNSSGSVVQELSYDAWGQLRNPTNQTVYAPDAAPELFLGRGYTGHEHLAMFGLVNMNARLYDPALERFLAPDPFVQSPLFSQNFNRYSYALNNPFKYTDPNGECPWLIIGIIAAFTYLYNAHANTPKNKDSGNPANWAWNPGKWNTTVVANVNYNTSGSWTFSGGVGNPNNPVPVVGYNTQYGTGVGMSYNGSSNMYYPGYDSRVTQSFVQNANNAIYNARQDYFGAQLAIVGIANSGAGAIQGYNAMDLAASLKRGAGTWNPAHVAAYEKQLLNAKVANLKLYYAGKALGVLNAGYIGYQRASGQISSLQFYMEEGSNVIATSAKGVYGAAWALGWETGRQITLTSGYQEMKFNFWRNRMEGIYGPPSELNRHLWEEFYLEYFKY